MSQNIHIGTMSLMWISSVPIFGARRRKKKLYYRENFEPMGLAPQYKIKGGIECRGMCPHGKIYEIQEKWYNVFVVVVVDKLDHGICVIYMFCQTSVSKKVTMYQARLY